MLNVMDEEICGGSDFWQRKVVLQVVDLPEEKLQALHKDAKNLFDSYIKVDTCHLFYFC